MTVHLAVLTVTDADTDPAELHKDNFVPRMKPSLQPITKGGEPVLRRRRGDD